MANTGETIPITIQYGHDDTHVLMIFSMPIQNNRMTVQQTYAMIEALQGAIAGLAARQGKGH